MTDDGFKMHFDTYTVRVSARKKGETGPQSAGWVCTITGVDNDNDAIASALSQAEAKFGEEYDNFRMDRTGDNYTADCRTKLYDYEVGAW
jgi:hypothetical protein